MLTVALVFLVAHSVSPFSLLPSNLMVEAGNNKVPVYYNALNLLRSTVLDTSVYNINITTLIIIVLFNAIMGKIHLCYTSIITDVSSLYNWKDPP